VSITVVSQEGQVPKTSMFAVSILQPGPRNNALACSSLAAQDFLNKDHRD
jgi:hypothetical protein